MSKAQRKIRDLLELVAEKLKSEVKSEFKDLNLCHVFLSNDLEIWKNQVDNENMMCGQVYQRCSAYGTTEDEAYAKIARDLLSEHGAVIIGPAQNESGNLGKSIVTLNIPPASSVSELLLKLSIEYA